MSDFPLMPIRLYCNPATSEVAGEYPTLHDAIAAATDSLRVGARLICNGVTLATFDVARGWLLERTGFDRLFSEYVFKFSQRNTVNNKNIT